MASSRKSASAKQPDEKWVNPGKTPQEVSAWHFKRKIELMELEKVAALRQQIQTLRELVAEMSGSRAQVLAALRAERRLQELGF